MEEFLTIAGAATSEFTEKKSRFVSDIFPVQTEDDVKACMELVRKKYHDARHHCWCYRLKSGAVRYSDDGEPQGTACLLYTSPPKHPWSRHEHHRDNTESMRKSLSRKGRTA